MSESLAPSWLVSLGGYLQEESENQWFWFSVFIALMVVGAFWIEASQTLPGVSESPLLDEGESMVEVSWNQEGTAALMITERGDGSPLKLFDSSGLHSISIGETNPNSVSVINNGWLVSGDDGVLANTDGTDFNIISLIWPSNQTLDIISAASNDGVNGFILSKQGPTTRLHSFSEGIVSEGSSAPVASTMMTDIYLSTDNKLVIITGYDTALGNPTFGPSGEVVIRADSVMGNAPTLTLLHHGAGSAIHSAYFVNSSHDWGENVEMMLAGGSSTMLLLSDFTIVDLPGVGGSTAAAVDDNGAFWFARSNSEDLLNIIPNSDEVVKHKLSNSVIVDAELGTFASGEVMFYGTGVDGSIGVMSFDPNANHDVSQSLARIGDLIFVIVVVCSIAIVGHMFWINHFKPW